MLPIVCRPATVDPLVPLPAAVEVVGWPSGAAHDVAGDPYRQARSATFMGKRLAEAAAHRVVGEATARDLADVYEFLLQLRLREQLRRFEAGEEPDNRICYDDLTGLEQSRLRDCLRRLSTIQKTTAARLSGP